MSNGLADLEAAALRQKAESLLKLRPLGEAQSEADVRRLLHELQVHQIELELQNDALRQSELDTLDALQRLAKLKDELVISRDLAVAASRAKSAFLSHMSHELRTPLSGTMGMTQLALTRATDPEQINWLQKSLQAANHLLSVILDISKIEADKLVMMHSRFTLAGLVDDLSNMVAPKAADKGLSLTFDISPTLANQPLWGDAMRLMQILLNLTSNSLKFTEAGSVLAHIEVAEESLDELLLRFEVTDTGIGIAEEDRLRIFSSFEQADGSITRRFGGTGLGLAISKRLAQLMGGRIGVLSEKGRGSTFWFTARVQKHAPTAQDGTIAGVAMAKNPQLAELAGAHILVVDDDPMAREVLRTSLERVGIQVKMAADGAAAIALAREQPCDLCLMDVAMPGMNGIEATHALRCIPDWKHTPILALTANALGDDRHRCLEAGMSDYLVKPLSSEALFASLLKWLPRSASTQ